MSELRVFAERVRARRSSYPKCTDEQGLVYACEDIVDQELGSPQLQQRQIQEFIFSVCHRENIEPPQIVRSRATHSLASAHLDTWTVCLTQRATTTSVILHELAHLSVGVDSHGVLFRDELVRLVRANISLEHAALLHALFHHVGLEMSPWAASQRRF